MERKKALEQLEVVRPDSDDLNDAELAEAITSLEDDAQARQEFDRRLEFDQKIATAMQAVSVPDGLKAKLIAATTAQPATEATKQDKRRSPRRVAIIAGMSLCLVIAAGFLLLQSKPTISHNEIVDFAPRDTAQLVNLASASSQSNGTLHLELPNWLNRMKLTPQLAWPSPNAALPSGEDKPTSLVMGGRNWVLVVTPRDRMSVPPAFGQAGTIGGSLATGHHHGAWQDEQFVYVLFVEGNRRDFDRVYKRHFGGATA